MSTLIWAGVAAGNSTYDHYYYDSGSWVGALSIPVSIPMHPLRHVLTNLFSS